jgi:hypothetical protein
VNEKKQQNGKRRVSAVIGTAAAKANVQSRRRTNQWPEPGEPYSGIKPGQWRTEGELDPTSNLPADCPVKPLGYDGESFYFVDTMGQVFCTGDKQMGVERVQKLFAGNEDFLWWAWPSVSQKGSVQGFKAEQVRRDLYAAGHKRGPWTPTDMVRGRGAWQDDQGRLILHCGDYLWIDGKLADTGEVGEHFYARRPASFVPWGKPIEQVSDNPAVELFTAMRTWNFVRGNIDVMLLMGWIGVALMGAALDWRPSIFMVGDAGTGKSELHRLLKAVLGRLMISTTNATEAGLYQIVGHDNLPICIDELEGEDGQAQAARIIKMARDAASGSVRIRGGADHKGVEFSARSTFLFSAINPPPIPPASLTRLAILQLRQLPDNLGQVPVLKAADTIGPRLLRRVADHWQDFERILTAYRDVLREAGHDSRGQMTFGTFLAAAHLLLSDEGMDALGLHWEKLDQWGIYLQAETLPELGGKQPNWLQCVEDLMTAQIDAFSKGEKKSIAQVLEELDRNDTPPGFGFAQDKLALADVGLLKKGLVGEGYALAIPNSSKGINRLLADTAFGGRGGNGNWSWALRQGPENIILHRAELKRGRKPDNRVSIAGFQRRCTFISLGDLKAYQATE